MSACAVCELPLINVDPHELDNDEPCHPECCPTCQADRPDPFINALSDQHKGTP